MAHSHDVFTVILVTNGAVQVEIERINYRVGAGDLVVIGTHQIHAARPAVSAGWQMRSLHLPPHFLATGHTTPVNPREAVSFANPVVPGGAAAALFFLDLHRSAEGGQSEAQQADHFQSFLAWFRANLETFGPQTYARLSGDPQLERARDLIAQTVFQNMLIDSIAEEVGLSAYALIRRFKKNYGISPHAWRIQARANAAARLLCDKAPLADIADFCGFADQSHMSRIFKKVYGVTPGQYGLMH